MEVDCDACSYLPSSTSVYIPHYFPDPNPNPNRVTMAHRSTRSALPRTRTRRCLVAVRDGPVGKASTWTSSIQRPWRAILTAIAALRNRGAAPSIVQRSCSRLAQSGPSGCSPTESRCHAFSSPASDSAIRTHVENTPSSSTSCEITVTREKDRRCIAEI